MTAIPLRLTRRALAAGAAVLAAPSVVRAQAWPARPITLVVGFPPGGQTDFAARVLQPALTAALGQTVVIENRGGAGGNLGTEAVLRAAPDGYTLLAGNANPLTINPHTFPGMRYDPLLLSPIGMMLRSSLILCVHPSVPANNVAQFREWAAAEARRKPGGADYGSASAGSLSHVAMELFRNRIGNPAIEHVPYRGSGPAMQDFIAGRFSAMFDGASVVAPFIKAGQLRGILVTGADRTPAFPDIATSAEQGLTDFTFTAWIGLFGPPGLPAEIVARANAALNQAVADAQARTRITTQGDEPGGGTAEALGQTMRADHARWGEVVRANNIRSDG